MRTGLSGQRALTYQDEVTLAGNAGTTGVIGVFGELLTGSKTDDVIVSFQYPFYNDDFDLNPLAATGDGAASVADSLLTASSATTGTALVSSKNSVRYRAGHTGFIDFTASFAGAGIGLVGGFDASDGFFIRASNGAMSVGRRRAGVDTLISQANWNGDTLPAWVDFSKINIYRILFGYLGVADVIYQIRLDKWYTLHTSLTEGRLNTTTVANPSFPVSVYAQNGMSVQTASWNAGTINGNNNEYGARYFTTTASKALSGTNLATIGNFLNTPTYKGVTNKVKATLLRYKFFIDTPASGVGTVEFRIRKNATLTGVPSYTAIDADNSVMYVDTTATYNTRGLPIFIDDVGYTASTPSSASDFGGPSELAAQSFGLYLLPSEVATITAQNVFGNTNVTVRIIFNWIEFF